MREKNIFIVIIYVSRCFSW